MGFDAYEKNFTRSKQALENLPSGTKTHFFQTNFRNIATCLESVGIQGVSHVYADLGVSSVHFDDEESSFSFRSDAPLDMRLDIRSDARMAREIIAGESFERLADIFRIYADEKNAGRIARAIVNDREDTPFDTTRQLADLIDRVTHSKKSIARCFQALRIAVNDEYGALEDLLDQAHDLLLP